MCVKLHSIRPPEICLVYEICSHGDLASFIFSQNNQLSEYSRYNSNMFGYNGHTLNTTLNVTMNNTFTTPTQTLEKYNNTNNEQSDDILRFESTDQQGIGIHIEDIISPDLMPRPDLAVITTTNASPIRASYQPPTTILSDNTTIPSAKLSNISHTGSPQKAPTTPVITGNIKSNLTSKGILGSPTDESSINTNKYVVDRTHDEIINSLKGMLMLTLLLTLKFFTQPLAFCDEL